MKVRHNFTPFCRDYLGLVIAGFTTGFGFFCMELCQALLCCNPFWATQIADILIPGAGAIKRKTGDGAVCFSDAILFISRLIQRCFPVNQRGEQYCPLLKHKAPICHKSGQGASHGQCICSHSSGITTVSGSFTPSHTLILYPRDLSLHHQAAMRPTYLQQSLVLAWVFALDGSPNCFGSLFYKGLPQRRGNHCTPQGLPTHHAPTAFLNHGFPPSP